MKKPVWRPRCPQLFGQVNPSDPYLRLGRDDGTEVRHDQAIFEYRSTIAREATGRDTRASKAGATGRSQTPAGKPRNTACATAFVRGLGKHLKPIRFRAGTPDPNARYLGGDLHSRRHSHPSARGKYLRFWQECRRPGPNTRSSLENGVTFTSLLLPRRRLWIEIAHCPLIEINDTAKRWSDNLFRRGDEHGSRNRPQAPRDEAEI